MGLREKLNENPAITTAVAAGIILLALIFLGWSLLPRGGSTMAAGENDAYYTTDNGKTFEEGGYFDLYNQPVGGNEKYRVQVFKWKDGGEPFIGWMERLSPDARKAYKEAQEQGTGDPMMMMGPEDAMIGLFVAKPPQNGDPQWVRADTPEGNQIMQPPVRDGQRAIPVYP